MVPSLTHILSLSHFINSWMHLTMKADKHSKFGCVQLIVEYGARSCCHRFIPFLQICGNWVIDDGWHCCRNGCWCAFVWHLGKDLANSITHYIPFMQIELLMVDDTVIARDDDVHLFEICASDWGTECWWWHCCCTRWWCTFCEAFWARSSYSFHFCKFVLMEWLIMDNTVGAMNAAVETCLDIVEFWGCNGWNICNICLFLLLILCDNYVPLFGIFASKWIDDDNVVAMNDVMYIHAWHCVIFEVEMDDVFVGLWWHIHLGLQHLNARSR